jgi:DNA-binding transcriptional LysR family regulator
MEIHQVRYFLAVCEHLSFTQAARQCHVTQPSLTRAIQHLEKEFGVYLFDRRRSKVRLTELGKLVQPYLQEAWEQAHAAKKEARDYASKAPTQLNLAIMCTIAPGLLIQMFARFRNARPDIKLDLTTSGPKDVLYGNAPDPIFPGCLLRAQFHARRKTMSNLPAIDHCGDTPAMSVSPISEHLTSFQRAKRGPLRIERQDRTQEFSEMNQMIRDIWRPIGLLLASDSTSREILASDGRYCCIITGGLLR